MKYFPIGNLDLGHLINTLSYLAWLDYLSLLKVVGNLLLDHVGLGLI